MVNEEIRSRIRRHLIEKTDFVSVKDRMTEEQLRAFVDRAISELCFEEQIDLSTDDRISLVREFVSANVNMGPLRTLFEDEDITEIMVNGTNKVYIQKYGKISLTDLTFESEHQLMHLVQKLLANSSTNRRLDESSPFVDFSLPDGSRINAIIPPCTNIGPVVTIRKFSKSINTIDDLINLGMLDKKMAAFLIAAVKAKLNIVFCGSTGTGKTTTLNVLSRHIPEEERIVTIEDTPELRLMQDHVVSLQTKVANVEGRGEITMQDLFINSLRMRPDRLIVGEVRSHEIMDLVQSIVSGHSGSLSVVHADSPEDCFNRMATMMMMAGLQLSMGDIKKEVARAVDLIVHIELFKDGVRRLANITDVTFNRKEEKVLLRDIFTFLQDEYTNEEKIRGHWDMDSIKPSFYSKFDKHNVKLPEGLFKA